MIAAIANAYSRNSAVDARGLRLHLSVARTTGGRDDKDRVSQTASQNPIA